MLFGNNSQLGSCDFVTMSTPPECLLKLIVFAFDWMESKGAIETSETNDSSEDKDVVGIEDSSRLDCNIDDWSVLSVSSLSVFPGGTKISVGDIV